MINLPADWSSCERGNTWLVDPEGQNHVGYFDLPNDQRLEVTVTPGNYPGFNLQVLSPASSADEFLSKHINELIHDRGWDVRKCNVEGVRLPSDEDEENGTGGSPYSNSYGDDLDMP